MKNFSKKEFDAVAYMRQERERISKDISEMTHKEILEYFKKRRSKERIPIKE